MLEERVLGAWMLGAFLVVFVITRIVTRMIRVGRGPFRNIGVGGVHVHHLVPGIFLLLVAGAGEFAYRPDGLWQVVLAVAFGAGAALTLDEFALWLRLSDVYWEREGRLSVGTVLVAGALGMLVVLGADPLSVEPEDGVGIGATTIAFTMALSFVAVLKGKPACAVLGLFLPVIALVASVRLAKPNSVWARRWYSPSSRRAGRARARFPDGERTWWDRLAEGVGGRFGHGDRPSP
jgi:hypothetical protein